MGKCSCIEDDGCDGYYWTLYTGQPITSNSSCTWTRGNLIVKVEYKYYRIFYLALFHFTNFKQCSESLVKHKIMGYCLEVYFHIINFEEISSEMSVLDRGICGYRRKLTEFSPHRNLLICTLKYISRGKLGCLPSVRG